MWADRNARLFVGVSVVSGFGSTAMSLVGSVWVLSLTGSATLAALVGLCTYAPTLAGPALGAAVDRLPRQRTLIWTCLALAAMLLTLLAVRSAREVWLVYTVMLVCGVSYVILAAAESALLPASLPGDVLGQINGLRMGAQEGVKLVAPLAGAGLFALTGNGRPVAILASATLLVAAGLYRGIRSPQAMPAKTRTSLRAQIGEGIRFLWRTSVLRACATTAAVAVAMSGLATAATYFFVTHDLHRAPEFLGVLGSAQGAGSIVSGVAAGWMIRRVGERGTAAIGAGIFAMATLSRCVPAMPLAVCASVLIGLGLPWTVVATMTAVQRLTPPRMVGNVAATATTVVFGPIAAALAIGAPLPAWIGYRATFLAAAGLSLLSGLIATGLAGVGGRSQ